MKKSTSLSPDVVVTKDSSESAQSGVAETPWEDLRAAALKDYEDKAAATHSWLSTTPRAINFYFDNYHPSTSSDAEGADCHVAKVIPVGHSYSVAIGSLGIKLFESLADAQEVRDAINNAIACERDHVTKHLAGETEMRKPEYWESQERQEQYAEWLKSQPGPKSQPPLDPIAAAVAKARGDILTDDDMKANIDFLNKMAARIKAVPTDVDGS